MAYALKPLVHAAIFRLRNISQATKLVLQMADTGDSPRKRSAQDEQNIATQRDALLARARGEKKSIGFTCSGGILLDVSRPHVRRKAHGRRGQEVIRQFGGFMAATIAIVCAGSLVVAT